jgi:hypothetical protein
MTGTSWLDCWHSGEGIVVLGMKVAGPTSRSAIGLIVGLMIVLAACGTQATNGTVNGPDSVKLPRETIQFRPVLATSATTCRATNIRENPKSNQTVSLLGPLTGSLPGVISKTETNADPGCTLLGPAVLASSKVSEIQLGRTPAGGVTVDILLNASEVARLRVMTVYHPTKFYAVVALGQVLSYPTGSQLTDIGENGQFQIAGGLSLADRRPSELAQVLDSRSVEVKSVQLPGVHN